MEKLTITRALAELKLLNKKIDDKIDMSSFVGVMQKRHSIVIGLNITIQEFETKSKASLVSIKDLIFRYRMMKNAVLKSNAKTKIKIGDKTYTVTEAIELKNSIEFDKNLKSKLSNDYTIILDKIETNRIKLADDIEKMIIQNLGNDRKAQKDTYDNIAEPLIEANRLTLVKGFDVEKEIEKLNTSIEEFESEVDFTLSESNSQTYIEI